MEYHPICHFQGVVNYPISFISRLPWLYTIFSIGSRIIYIGETQDQGGVVGRLSSHFGPYSGSTLLQKASEIKNINRLLPPYIVICARLPLTDEDIELTFNGESKQVRLLCEAILHERVATKFIPYKSGWTIISTPTGSRQSSTTEIEYACDSIFNNIKNSFDFLDSLSKSVPFQIIALDRKIAQPVATEQEIGNLIGDIELSLFENMSNKLKIKYGDNWWSEGVPEQVRLECSKRQELEASSESIPREAYMSLIDLRPIAIKNWDIFGNIMETISSENGKEKATKWIVELNDVRKLWAHPLKRKFCGIDPNTIIRIGNIRSKVFEILPDIK